MWHEVPLKLFSPKSCIVHQSLVEHANRKFHIRHENRRRVCVLKPQLVPFSLSLLQKQE